MILQELVRYYERKAADPQSGIAPPGWELKEIPFVIVIDRDGKFVQLDDTRSGEGKKKRGRSFLVPQGEKKTSGIKANILWDNLEYVLGIDAPGKEGKAQAKHEAFKQRLSEELAGHEDAAVHAIQIFYDSGFKEYLSQEAIWEEIKESNPTMTFRMKEDSPEVLIFHRDSLRQSLDYKGGESDGVCLVTGEAEEIEPLHPSIKGVWGAQTAGANIVSFNKEAFTSYGKTQNYNAPVGKHATFAYTTALNTLLAKDSTQRMQVGDASTIFWADHDGEMMEDIFADLFTEPDKKSDPDKNSRAVKELYRSVESGAFAIDGKDRSRFFVLGLAPNAARISVRFWLTGTVSEFAQKIRRHFDDITIVHRDKEPKHLSLFRLLVATATADKSDNIPPNLGGDVMRAILSGTAFPQTLLQGAIRRIRATQNITYARAAIIKACLNRQSRFSQTNHKELTVSLDPENTHPAYLLGRLFALLEKIQKDAQPGINATIRDRFYGSFSAAPSSVFATLMRLKNHHLAKLDEGKRNYYEKLIGEIVTHLPASGAPSHLMVADQGRFAIGYYHQNHALYTKKETGEKHV